METIDVGVRHIEKEVDRSNLSSRDRYWVGSRGRRHDCWGLRILNDYIWEGHLSCLDVIDLEIVATCSF